MEDLFEDEEAANDWRRDEERDENSEEDKVEDSETALVTARDWRRLLVRVEAEAVEVRVG